MFKQWKLLLAGHYDIMKQLLIILFCDIMLTIQLKEIIKMLKDGIGTEYSYFAILNGFDEYLENNTTLSKSTNCVYSQRVRQLCHFMIKGDITKDFNDKEGLFYKTTFKGVSFDDVKCFKSELTKFGYKTKSIASSVFAIKRFFDYIETLGFKTFNLDCFRVRISDDNADYINILTKQQIDDIINIADPWAKVAIKIVFETGITRTQLVGLAFDDFDYDKRIMTVKVQKKSSQINNRPRRCLLSEDTINTVMNFEVLRKQDFVKWENAPSYKNRDIKYRFLFQSKGYNSTSYNKINMLVKNAVEEYIMDKELNMEEYSNLVFKLIAQSGRAYFLHEGKTVEEVCAMFNDSKKFNARRALQLLPIVYGE